MTNASPNSYLPPSAQAHYCGRLRRPSTIQRKLSTDRGRGSEASTCRGGGLVQTPAFWGLRCAEGTGLCCPLSPVDPCGARTRHSSSNTASLTTANPQANSPARAGPGYCSSVSLGASFRCRRGRGENADSKAVAHAHQLTGAGNHENARSALECGGSTPPLHCADRVSCEKSFKGRHWCAV